jgi:hypothetical protein
VTTVKTGLPQRVWNWFWRADEIRAHRRSKSARLRELELRSLLASDIARRAEESAEPFPGNIDAFLCDLYCQSIHWARRALAPAGPEHSEPLGWPELAALDPRLANIESPAFAQARDAAESFSFERLAELPQPERAALLPKLRELAVLLLSRIDADDRAVVKFRGQRFVRVGAILVAIACAVLTQNVLASRAEVRRDIAADKEWRASSASPGASTCKSPKQECDESPEFFFHTNEENRPWFEVDLGGPQSFSAVRVENRKDCCTDRAFPLSIEVSSDKAEWRKVARRDTAFDSWLAKFEPVTARYVRLEKREQLHLARVRVLQ